MMSEHGIRGVFNRHAMDRQERIRVRRSERDEERRWIAHGHPNEDQKVDIIANGKRLFRPERRYCADNFGRTGICVRPQLSRAQQS
jgi:hypothetical protein